MRFLLFVLIGCMSFCSAAWAVQPETAAKQAIIMDMQTGQVLLEKNADQRMPTSSMSKVMTVYMVFSALKSGQIDMDTEFTVSEKAWKKGGSKMFVEVGDKVKVSDLLRGVIVQSGNDATIVLAEGLGGSENAFAARMTEKAHQMGMKNSNFTNASGWPDDNHYSTARDLAILASRMMQDFPEYYKIYSEKEFTYADIKQANRNPLLYRDIGADGLKTGHTEVGGYGLIGTAKQKGRRVLMVLNGMESQKERAEESGRLIEWGLYNFKNVMLFKKGEAVMEAPVSLGKDKTVSLVTSQSILVTVPHGIGNSADNVRIDYQKPLTAPLKEGNKVGTITLAHEGMGKHEYDLLVGNSVEELGAVKKLIAKTKLKFLGHE